MIRSIDTVIHELLERRLLTLHDLVGRGVVAKDASRRNLSLHVTFLDGSGGVVVKEPDRVTRTEGTLAREARFYRYCERKRALAGMLPQLLLVDEPTGALFLAWVPHAVTVREQLRSEEPDALALLGRQVGASLVRLRHASSELRDFFGEEDGRPPWAMSAHRPSPAVLTHASGGSLDVLRILQKERALCDALDAARRAWKGEAIIHGDVKGDNIVSGASSSEVVLLDWEGVQMGDAAWDVAGIFQDVLLAWLDSMAVSDEAPEVYVADAKRPLAGLVPFTQGMWSAYRGALGAGETAPFLRRVVEQSAIRLVQSATERLAGAPRITRHAVAILQLAANILADPHAACSGLFGVEPLWRADGVRGLA